ncbi:MAG: hypothetical protein CAPSK01_003198 [Candidatus Accumulibacter vicinus]|nr:MAG: hypothetical protein CAPSK01_003198 [Candidatus Accumulibacter vicinus]
MLKLWGLHHFESHPIPACLPGSARRTYIMRSSFIKQAGSIMEAEQLNLIENRLADLGQRATELRRYL